MIIIDNNKIMIKCVYNELTLTHNQILKKKQKKTHTHRKKNKKNQIKFQGVSKVLFDDVICHFLNPFEFLNF